MWGWGERGGCTCCAAAMAAGPVPEAAPEASTWALSHLRLDPMASTLPLSSFTRPAAARLRRLTSANDAATWRIKLKHPMFDSWVALPDEHRSNLQKSRRRPTQWLQD